MFILLCRIHIFDVKPNGSYINGNTNGSLSFKIRENEGFESDLTQIQGEIKNKMGLELKQQDKSVIRNPYV